MGLFFFNFKIKEPFFKVIAPLFVSLSIILAPLIGVKSLFNTAPVSTISLVLVRLLKEVMLYAVFLLGVFTLLVFE